MMTKGATTRDRIVGHALALASVDGLEALSLGELANDVGMSKSGLFAHFRSKEALQLDVLNAAVENFRRGVIVPALAEPRGAPRVRALFSRWLEWERSDSMPGGCVFVHAAFEWDDRTGPVREAIAAFQREWLEFLAGAAQRAIDEGHFHRGSNPEQFAFQMLGIVLAYYWAKRLLRDPQAKHKAIDAFTALVEGVRC
ncbi:MAG TPA: TetR/AcrR family transcriptional regulator [Gemmatimonadaceae bacterium]|nr:TetR/AcrR family transcriptional regulator [Gemmatimonadaceae bacterium]